MSVKDSVFLHVTGIAGSARAVNFIWSLDSHPLAAAPVPDSTCRLYFSISDTGIHRVTVLGFGQGYAQSEQETSIVTVLLNPPVVHFVTHDTSIWANDSVQIFAT